MNLGEEKTDELLFVYSSRGSIHYSVHIVQPYAAHLSQFGHRQTNSGKMQYKRIILWVHSIVIGDCDHYDNSGKESAWAGTTDI